jgi:hypothetical protein
MDAPIYLDTIIGIRHRHGAYNVDKKSLQTHNTQQLTETIMHVMIRLNPSLHQLVLAISLLLYSRGGAISDAATAKQLVDDIHSKYDDEVEEQSKPGKSNKRKHKSSEDGCSAKGGGRGKGKVSKVTATGSGKKLRPEQELATLQLKHIKLQLQNEALRKSSFARLDTASNEAMDKFIAELQIIKNELERAVVNGVGIEIAVDRKNDILSRLKEEDDYQIERMRRLTRAAQTPK